MKTGLKRFFIVVFLCIFAATASAAYVEGDIIPDISWKESDGGDPVDNSVHSVIDSGKVLIIEFAATW